VGISGGWGVIYCFLQSDFVRVGLAAAQEEELGPEGGFVGGSDEERAFGDVFEDEDVRAERIAMQAGAGSCHTISSLNASHEVAVPLKVLWCQSLCNSIVCFFLGIVGCCSGGGCQAATGLVMAFL
jgi:hypothetical protein